MIQARRSHGRIDASRKYDILTVLGAWALAQSGSHQRTVLRLITLVTARYNWQTDRLTIGQREIASLWGCNERTVKREMGRLRDRDWLRLVAQGRRGRVAEYALGVDAILSQTRPAWARIGPDFVARLATPACGDAAGPAVAPTPCVPAPEASAGDPWSMAAAAFHAEDPSSYGAWVRALRPESRAGEVLVLAAPSRFHAAYVETHLKDRLLSHLRAMDIAIAGLRIVA